MARSILKSRWLRLSLGGLLILASLLVAGVWALSGAAGRWVLAEVLEGREIAVYGTLHVEDIQGNLLKDIRIGQLDISDQDGVWLTLEDAQVRWRLLSLIGGPITVDSIEVQSLSVLRRPVRAPQEPREGSGSFNFPNLQLTRIELNLIELAEGVAGPEADFTMSGNLTSAVSGALAVGLSAQRTDEAGDQAELDLSRQRNGQLIGEVKIIAPSGGPLATLARLEDQGWSLEGELGGDLNRGDGEFDFLIGSDTASSGTLTWDANAWTLAAELHAERWPGLPGALDGFAANAELQANGGLQAFTVEQLSLQTDALEVQAFDLLADAPRGELRLTETGAQLASQYGVRIRTGELSFEQVSSDPETRYEAALSVTGLEHPLARAERLNAQFDIAALEEGYQVEAGGMARGLTSEDQRLATLLGDAISFRTNLTTEGFSRFDVQTLALTADGWTLSGDGVWGTAAQRRVSARIDLAELGPLDLAVNGPLSATVRSAAGERLERFDITATSPSLSADGQAGGFLGALEASAELQINSRRITLPSVQAQTDAVTFTGDVRQTGSGWQAAGDALVALAPLGIDGLEGQAATGFDLNVEEGLLTLRAQAETDTLSFGETRIEAPRLRTELSYLGGALDGVWQIDAAALEEAMRAQGTLQAEGTAAEFIIETAVWGELTATGRARREAQQVIATLSVDDGTFGRTWTGEARYDGMLNAPLDGAVTGALALENWALGSGSVTRARLEFDGPLSNLPVQASAAGLFLQPFDLELNAGLQLDDAGLDLTADLAGSWGDETIATVQPVRVATGNAGLEGSGELTLGGADLTVSFARADTLDFTASLSDAPARLVTNLAGLPDATGTWSVRADLSQTSDLWQGDIIATLVDIQPASAPEGGSLSGAVQLALGEQARFTTDATAGGLSLNADLMRPDPVTDLAVLLDPGWRGGVDINGPLDTLARLYLPETENFTGRIEGAARFEAGEVSGNVDISQGRYRSQTAGVRLEPFALTAEFSNDRLNVSEARLGDGNGGIAAATGSIGFTEAGLNGSGDVNFTRFRAVARPELTVVATGAAQLELQGRQLSVTGETLINRLALTPVAPSGPSIPQIEVEELNRPDSLDPAYRRPIQITLDYRVRAEDSLYVSSRAFNSEWSADVRVEGPLNRLTLGGQANLESGQASLLTRQFDMDEGQISFNGPIERTRVLLQGRHLRNGLEVIARAEGPISEPQVSFTSNPPLPEDEVLARLLFDQSTAALSPLQAAQLAAQLSGRNWLGALSDAGRMVGLDRLTLREGENGGVALAAGRQLSEDVYLELETGTASNLGAARIEWSITPDIVVLSRLTGDTNAQLAIHWRREFE